MFQYHGNPNPILCERLQEIARGCEGRQRAMREMRQSGAIAIRRDCTIRANVRWVEFDGGRGDRAIFRAKIDSPSLAA